MHYHLKSLSLATATLLLSLFTPLLPLTWKFEPLVVQAQTLEQQEPGAERWYLEAYQLLLKGDYPEALNKLQQHLVTFRKKGDRARVGAVLTCIGMVYSNMGQYTQALEYSQNALALLREVSNLPNGDSLRDSSASRSTARTWEGRTLYSMGLVYGSIGEYTKALEYSQQALAINREVSDRLWEGRTLNSIGGTYYYLGKYPKALEFFKQALAIYKEVGNRFDEGRILSNFGLVSRNLGEYSKALEFFEQALAIHKQIGDRAAEGTSIRNLGLVYRNLGQYPKALDFFQEALAIHQQIGNKGMEGTTLSNIGAVYWDLGQYSKALELFQQALAIRTDIGDKAGKGETLNNIGAVYDKLGQYPKAVDFFQQALTIAREIGDKAGEGGTLNNIGAVYDKLGQYPKAVDFFQQALAIAKEIGDKVGEGTTLNNIGFLLDAQNQPELAIVFFKQSINVTEGIRRDLRVLPKEQQQSYTETVADTYRRLADLLLQQDRVLEAQRVLDLLKVQELDEYLRNVRGNEQTQEGIDYLPQEQQLITQYNAKLTQVIQQGRELEQLQAILKEKGELTPEQDQKRQEIEIIQGKTLNEFLSLLETPQVIALVAKLNRTTSGETLNPRELRRLQDDLKQLQQDAVLLYPLILEDRLELVLATPYAPPIRRPVSVKREDLNRAIAEFRSALTNPNADATKPAQQLYTWLIQPIEAALKEANAKTIIYAPDGQLRYIPLAALYDGNQWLVQKYRVNNITALSLTDLNKQPQPPKILAGAFSQGNYSFQVGDRTFNFRGLPFAGKEVDTLAANVPNTTKLINSDFNQDNVKAIMSKYSILHLATHAAFVPGLPEESFILFGDGDRANFRAVERWSLTNTDLVVLSACETGVGGRLGDGKEILGFGYLMQEAGARAAIASLWSVNDGGTQALMDAFYTALENGTTKAEALRQAQIALITGDYTALGKERGLGIEQRINTNLPQKVANQLGHPYYWAPFILIGNGL
ncbi:MAG: tetratricopeptide repeat protein [Cyanobacteriota bacterium]